MQTIDWVYLVIFSVMTFSAILWLTIYFKNREILHTDPVPDRLPSVSIIVPAYNEEEFIGDTLEALLDQDYPEDLLTIIAVNDGSEDNTLEEMKKYKDRITIIDKENTGKANSINYALERVETEIVGCMDGDSFPQPGLVKSMVGYFDDPEVKGVTPAIKVHNPQTWAQKVIWAEYIYQIFLRKIFSLFEAQYVLPGPGSLYRTSFLRSIDGWDEETLTEDMEVAFRIIKEGGILRNSTNAYVETVSPPTFKGLFRQRIRWYKGYINNFIKYREFVFNREYGNIGVFFLPFTVLWVVLLMFLFTHTAISLLGNIHTYIGTYQLVGFMWPTLSLSVQSVSLFHLFYFLFILVGILTLLLSLRISDENLELRRRKVHYLLFLWLYAMLFAAFWVAATFSKIKGDKKW